MQYIHIKTKQHYIRRPVFRCNFIAFAGIYSVLLSGRCGIFVRRVRYFCPDGAVFDIEAKKQATYFVIRRNLQVKRVELLLWSVRRVRYDLNECKQRSEHLFCVDEPLERPTMYEQEPFCSRRGAHKRRVFRARLRTTVRRVRYRSTACEAGLRGKVAPVQAASILSLQPIPSFASVVLTSWREPFSSKRAGTTSVSKIRIRVARTIERTNLEGRL